MKYIKLTIVLAAAALLFGAALSAQEKTVKMADLPAAVQRTVSFQLARGATLRRLSTDVEGGKREFEAELTINGRHRDIAMDPSGDIIEQEDAIALASLPAAAQAALRRQGSVLSVERVSDHGKFLAYEAVVRDKSGRRHEVRVNQAGR